MKDKKPTDQKVKLDAKATLDQLFKKKKIEK